MHCGLEEGQRAARGEGGANEQHLDVGDGLALGVGLQGGHEGTSTLNRSGRGFSTVRGIGKPHEGTGTKMEELLRKQSEGDWADE